MKLFVLIFSLLSIPTFYGVAAQNTPAKDSLKETSFTGRWHVKFTLMGKEEKNLVLIAQENGVASFEINDTGPDNKPVPEPQPAVWLKTLDNLSITSNVELPMGSCRETGTLIFKAKVTSDNSLSGKLIFVTDTDEEESPYQYHSTIGTFSATRLSK
jgi:hypothetical protein